MNKAEPVVAVVLRAIALAMAVAAIVLGLMGQPVGDTVAPLLGIGLFTLALAGLLRTK